MGLKETQAAVKRRIVRSSLYTGRSGTYRGAIRSCGAPDDPPATGRGFMIDYSATETTPDQARIEEVLAGEIGPDTVLLHVGVGNSQLATRFADRVARIDGLTVSENELELARSLGLDGYQVAVANKYAPRTLDDLHGPYDAIIDNNLTSFACCQDHVVGLLAGYARVLTDGGSILTDRSGMAWTVGDPRWSITLADLTVLGRPCGLVPHELTDHVIALRRT